VTVKEIRESGLLEYYVLGLLSEEEMLQVDRHLVDYPELKFDFLEIQKAVQAYAKAQGVVPKRNFEDDILRDIAENGAKDVVNPRSVNNQSPKANSSAQSKDNSGGMSGKIGFLMLAAFGLLAAWWGWNNSNQYKSAQKELSALQSECDSLGIVQNRQIEQYELLISEGNQSLKIAPTDNYQETDLLFHFNPVQKQNFIQISNMPSIAANQAFQLWSLKDGVDPIPLTVFKNGNDLLIPVDFEEGTGTYAITIEDEAGALSPTLTRLIGTITVV